MPFVVYDKLFINFFLVSLINFGDKIWWGYQFDFRNKQGANIISINLKGR